MNDEELIWESYKSKILNEAIPLSIAKKSLTRKQHPTNYTPEMNKIFNNKDRIILPFNSSEKIFVQSDTEKEIIDELLKNGWTLYHDDYLSGYITIQKQKYKLGRVLQNMNRLDLLDKFKKDTSRQTQNKDLVIVISRHPYDLVGASTDRNWQNCITRPYKPIVYKGKKEYDSIRRRYYKRGEENDPTDYKLKGYGTIRYELDDLTKDLDKCESNDFIIAYLVNKNELIKGGEKILLRKPLSRILFYIDEYDGTIDIVDINNPVYGVYSQDFLNQVDNWMKANFSNYNPFPVDEPEDEDSDEDDYD
jgi:LAS superfamily LD-carboxypeptidase LdcB